MMGVVLDMIHVLKLQMIAMSGLGHISLFSGRKRCGRKRNSPLESLSIS